MKLALSLLLLLLPVAGLARAEAAPAVKGEPFAHGVCKAGMIVEDQAAASGSPEAVVQAQLDAYNRRDLEGFLTFYSDDAVLKNHPDEVTQVGKDQMRARYAKRFANPAVRAQVLQRMVLGRFVVDEERITAAPAKEVIDAIAIYEVRDGKIVSVSFLLP